ncbi:MAG: glycerophosphodiester phosphodiesterase family protein [Akkermansiaceae bacterium]
MSQHASLEKSIWKNFQKNWKSLLAIQLLCLVLGILVLGPVFTFALQTALTSSGTTALSDTDIVAFFTNPVGLLIALPLAALWLTIRFVGYAAQLIVGHQSIHSQPSTAIESLSQLAKRFPSIIVLSLRVLIRIIAISLPFVAVILLLYSTQLGEKDINYYLATHPPEFIAVAAISAVLVVIMGALLVRYFTGWIHALPLILFHGKGAKSAKEHSLKTSMGQKKQVAVALALWGFGTPLLIIPITLPLPTLVLLAAETFQDRLGLLALTLATLISIFASLSFLIGFLTQSLLAFYNLKLFREAGLDSQALESQANHPTRTTPWRIMITATCLCLGVVTFICHQRLDRLTTKVDAVVIAHRGASADAPENTMAAIELAINAKSDWVEIDVQETASGEILVFHDKDFMRMSNSPTTLRDVTSEQVAKLDIGSWFDPKFSDQRTPTLQEVLELCRGRSGVLIELKYYGGEERLEERVINIVEKLNMVDQVKIMSLKLEGVEKVRKLRPKWSVGLLSSVAVGDLTKLDIDFLGLNASSVSNRLINRARRAGIHIYVWTVNEPATMSSMLSRGIDGLITDRPHTSRTVVDERSNLNPGERLLIDLAARFGRTPEIE